MTDPLVLALLALLVATATAIVLFADTLATVVAFGVYSLALAMLWAVFRAPDVALTEAAVGAGVTPALVLVVVFRVGLDDSDGDGVVTDEAVTDGVVAAVRTRLLAGVGLRSIAGVVAVGTLVALLLWTVPALPAVGDPVAPGFQLPVAEYVDRAPELGIRNLVTAVLVVFRGFDTFGEVVVVFAAGVAVLVAFDREVAR